jgi:hypothetical protein
MIELAAIRVSRRENGGRSVLEVAGRVALDGTDVVRNVDPALPDDEHNAELAHIVRHLAVAAEDTQDLLERATKHDAAGDTVACRLRGTNLIGERAPDFFSSTAIQRRYDERHAALREQPDECGKLAVKGVRGDE